MGFGRGLAVGFVWVGIWLGLLSVVFLDAEDVVVAVGGWQRAVNCVDEKEILF